MEKVKIEYLEPGSILAKSIYTADGKILIRQKTEVSASMISKLKELRLPSAYIQRSAADREIKDLVSDLTRSDLHQSLSKLDSEIRSGSGMNFGFCRQPLIALIDEVISNRKNLLGLTDIRLYNDYTYGHSVHVCIIAVKIALEMGYNQSELTDLAVGALFHDIGMTKMPYDILRRIGHLTKEEVKVIQSHPVTGHQMLLYDQDISETSARVALEHHEHFNGGGYPHGISGPEIHEFSRIITVADVYDAMTTDKVYRPARSSSEAVNYLKSQKGVGYDPEVVNVFEKTVTLSYS